MEIKQKYMRPSEFHISHIELQNEHKNTASFDASSWGLPKSTQICTRKHGSIEHITATAKALFLLFPILGLPWIFAFLVNLDGAWKTVFMYLNAIVNGAQGVFIFLLYCLMRKEVRHILSRKCNIIQFR